MSVTALYFTVAFFLFSVGLAIIFTKKNLVFLLMGVELLLNSVNIILVKVNQVYGANEHVMSLLILVVAAAEAAVFLAILINLYNRFKTVDIDKIY